MPALTLAAKTTPPLTNGCCTMTFAYCGDVHCQHGDQENQVEPVGGGCKLPEQSCLLPSASQVADRDMTSRI